MANATLEPDSRHVHGAVPRMLLRMFPRILMRMLRRMVLRTLLRMLLRTLLKFKLHRSAHSGGALVANWSLFDRLIWEPPTKTTQLLIRPTILDPKNKRPKRDQNTTIW